MWLGGFMGGGFRVGRKSSGPKTPPKKIRSLRNLAGPNFLTLGALGFRQKKHPNFPKIP